MIWKHLLSIPIEERHKTVVLFVDSRDVFVQAGKETIIANFLKQDSKVVFNAERNCWPLSSFPVNMLLADDPHRNPEGDTDRFKGYHICNSVFPKHGTNPQRWLNSGAFIGYADEVIRIFNVLQSIPDWLVNDWPGTDQAFFAEILLTGRFNVSLDVCSDVFLTLQALESYEETHSKTDLFKIYSKGPEMNGYNMLYAKHDASDSALQSVWVDKFTDRVPPILHFNGGFLKSRYENSHDRWMKPEARNMKNGKCSSNLPSLEAEMWGDSVLKAPRIPSMSTECANDPHVKMCLEGISSQLQECKLDSEISEFLHEKETSGLGFWTAFTIARLWTPFTETDHRKLAHVIFQGTKGAGSDEWLQAMALLREHSLENWQKVHFVSAALGCAVVIFLLARRHKTRGFFPQVPSLLWLQKIREN